MNYEVEIQIHKGRFLHGTLGSSHTFIFVVNFILNGWGYITSLELDKHSGLDQGFWSVTFVFV